MKPLRVQPAATWVVALLALGCSVPAFDKSLTEATPNKCEANSDCGDKGQCVAGVCRATQGTFTSVLFEITPPSDADPVENADQSIPIASIRFLKFIQGLSPAGGTHNIALDHVAHVMGRVIPHECVTAEGARVTFTPSEQLLGLPTQSYTADVVHDASMAFDQWLPPGTYDIYIQPAEGATDGCVVPQLIRNREIPAADVDLELLQPVPAEMDVTISWPTSSIEGWTLDVVDYMSGRVVSNQTQIEVANALAPVGERAQYFVQVRYVPVTGGEVGKELVRLSPPEGAVAPTLLMQRSALELFNQGTATIDQVVDLPGTVTLSGRVTTEDPDHGLPSTVTLIASKCDGLGDGTLAAFEREVETNPDGTFSVDVLAGSYSAYVVPAGGSGYAAAKVETIEIAASPSQQSGKLIQLAPSTMLAGRLLDPSGSEPLSGASVHAVASPASIQTTEFDLVRGIRPFVPRASTGCDRNALCNIVGADGTFSIEADPGHFDVSVQPPETTGFAWVVRPNVLVSSARADLGDMKMPAPVAYSGVVTAPNGAPVARALIRAYVYMSGADDSGRVVYLQNPDIAQSVLQIGETRTGDDASFTLLLPSGWE
jgi:hypothetical protein